MTYGIGRKSKERGVEWKVYISQPVTAAFEALYHVPHQGKPVYGLRTQIVNQLLKEHVTKLQEAGRAAALPAPAPRPAELNSSTTKLLRAVVAGLPTLRRLQYCAQLPLHLRAEAENLHKALLALSTHAALELVIDPEQAVKLAGEAKRREVEKELLT